MCFEQFNTAVQKLEEIQECHLVSGDFDYLLKTRVPDMSAYRKLLGGNPAASAWRQ
ncbi:leucine-responsive transcriptional regulator [Escherichia coli]|nr:leucine-responsive transcriptional regulator [Escherichia coli]